MRICILPEIKNFPYLATARFRFCLVSQFQTAVKSVLIEVGECLSIYFTLVSVDYQNMWFLGNLFDRQSDIFLQAQPYVHICTFVTHHL